jgi:asparagine synthase (glutamine-hydrolysing)
MVSASGRYVLAFNGEIYNFPQLRRVLEQARTGSPGFRGHSDTEIMLAAFEHWGVEAALKHMNGMFAFALWDRGERSLYLGRDRMGEKPLYYGWMGRTFLFASELKALRCHPEFCPEVDRDALALYFRRNCIPAPYSIYSGVYKLPPAALLVLSGNGPRATAPQVYWSLQEVAQHGWAEPFQGSAGDAVEAMDALLRDAVNLRMQSDVPLGALLSGGVDSSTVVALMQAQSARPVHTFTIGSCEQDYDEAHFAKRVAQHLGTEHTQFYVTPSDALAVVPRLPEIYDEPFADSSQIVTFLVAQMARRHVTVCLSGDGGDEVFGGYNRYGWSERIGRAVQLVPQAAREWMARAMGGVSPQRWDTLFRRCCALLPQSAHHNQFGYKVHKLAGILLASDLQQAYLGLTSHWREPEALVRGAEEPATVVSSPQLWFSTLRPAQRMMYLDSVTYLPDDILTKVDRATMAVSLEARVPLLDHRVVEFAWRLPLQLKIRRGTAKWILRRILARYVPQRLIDRPKAGFGLPLERWLQGPLREWAESLLEERRLHREGFLNPRPIREMWSDFLAGHHPWQYHLWDVLMFQAWCAAQASPSASAPTPYRLAEVA